MKLTRALFWLFAIGVAGLRKKLIIDTDLFSDVDDAAALLLAATSPTDILAVNVNHRSRYSALAASAILAHYGHGTVPIGTPRGAATDETFFDGWFFELGEFASKVAFHNSGGSLPWESRGEDGAWDAVVLYRKALAEADDGSVTVVSIGMFENLSGLLNSTADGHSSLSGQDLVADKVAELIIMGGAYPSGREWNFFGGNVSLARHVVDAWGRLTPVTYVGDELGRLVISGDRLMAEGPEGDPVKAAYEWYSYGRGERPSWDALAVLWALGDDEMLEFGNEGGYNQVAADGSNAWVWDGSEKGQHWLKMRDGVDGAAVGERLEELYLKGAWDAIRDSSSSDDDGRKEL